MTLKKKSIKLSLHTQEELQLNLIANSNNKDSNNQYSEINQIDEDNNNDNNNNLVDYIIDKSRVVEDFDTDKIDEIGFLLQKMFEALEYSKQDLELLLFSELDFSNENFLEELTRRIVATLKM